MSEWRLTANAQRVAEVGAVMLVLGLAATLRLHRLDLADLRFDEAIALRLARGIAEGHWLAIAPFSGSVANHPPAYLYVMALPYLFMRAWWLAFVWRVMLDVAAVGVTWWMTRRHFGRGAALIAALLFAVAPWAVQMARKTWLAVLPLGSALALWGLLEVVSRREAWGWALVGWGLVLTLGAHWSGLFALPLVGVVLLWRWRTVRALPALIGWTPLVLFGAAYLVTDLQGGASNMRALVNAGSGVVQHSLDALQRALWLSGGAHLSDLTGPAFEMWRAQPIWSWRWLDTLQQLWLGAGVLSALWLAWRAPHLRMAVLVVLAWEGVPIVLQVRHTQPVQMHYLLLTYPAPFVLMALVWQLVRRDLATRAVLLAVTMPLTTYHVVLTLHFSHFLEHHVTYPGGYGPPVRAALALSQAVRDEVQAGRACEVLVVVPGADPNVDEAATVLDVLLADLPRRFVNARDALIVREDAPLVYVFAPEAVSARDLAAQHYAEWQARAFPIAEQGGPAFHLARAAGLRMPGDLRPLPAQWAKGFGMLGYRAELRADTLHFEAYLRVFGVPREDVHWFAHLYAGEARIAQHDIAGVHPSQWREGDILLLRFVLPHAPPNAALHFGAYTFPEVARIPLINESGGAIGESVVVSLSAALDSR